MVGMKGGFTLMERIAEKLSEIEKIACDRR